MKMEIKKYLKEIGIEFKLHKHPPVYTCEEMEEYSKDIKGIHSKNLFIKNRKSKKYYLVILPAKKNFNFKKFEELLNEKLKFANENDLKHFLGLTSGSVSPFGLINDEEHKVEILIDKEVWNSDFVSFHPNINTETLELNGKDFQKYIKSLKNKLTLVDINEK